jgi:hypothetical protein
MEMPQHLSTFRLQRFETARRYIIGLRNWLLEYAFAGVDSNAPCAVCCLPTEEQEEHLNQVFSLIYEGVSVTFYYNGSHADHPSLRRSYYGDFVDVRLYSQICHSTSYPSTCTSRRPLIVFRSN